MSDKVIKAVQSLAKGKPLRYIIKHQSPRRLHGGNEKLAPIGEIVPFREPDYTAGPQGAIDTHRASVVSTLAVLNRMSAPTGAQPARAEGAWPDNTFTTPWKRLFFNDEPVHHHEGGGDHRRQQRRALSEVGCRQFGRPVRPDRLPDDRYEIGRRHQRGS
jgi:hypothetical protein